MAHHWFEDAHGVQWEAWDVVPTSAERRERERRTHLSLSATRQLPLGSAERRRGDRRRFQTDARAPISPALIRGWVVFQSRGERRRLAPIPLGWERLGTGELRALCQQAAPSAKPRRLIE